MFQLSLNVHFAHLSFLISCTGCCDLDFTSFSCCFYLDCWKFQMFRHCCIFLFGISFEICGLSQPSAPEWKQQLSMVFIICTACNSVHDCRICIHLNLLNLHVNECVLFWHCFTLKLTFPLALLDLSSPTAQVAFGFEHIPQLDICASFGHFLSVAVAECLSIKIACLFPMTLFHCVQSF